MLTDEEIAEFDREMFAGIEEELMREDTSQLWPISGLFNVTERAIANIKRQMDEGLVIDDCLSYKAVIEDEISRIVNVV